MREVRDGLELDELMQEGAAQNPSVPRAESQATSELNADQKYQNPLPCGCGIMGTPQLNGYGSEYELRQEYVNKFIKFCPLHASAPDLYAALERIRDERYPTKYQDGPLHAWQVVARDAIALVDGGKP